MPGHLLNMDVTGNHQQQQQTIPTMSWPVTTTTTTTTTTTNHSDNNHNNNCNRNCDHDHDHDQGSRVDGQGSRCNTSQAHGMLFFVLYTLLINIYRWTAVAWASMATTTQRHISSSCMYFFSFLFFINSIWNSYGTMTIRGTAADTMTMTPQWTPPMPQPHHGHQCPPPCHSCRRRGRHRNSPRDVNIDIFWTIGDDELVEKKAQEMEDISWAMGQNFLFIY